MRQRRDKAFNRYIWGRSELENQVVLVKERKAEDKAM